MYTLDTNAIIYYLKDDNAAGLTLNKIFSSNITVYISALTQIELLGFSGITAQEFRTNRIITENYGNYSY